MSGITEDESARETETLLPQPSFAPVNKAVTVEIILFFVFFCISLQGLVISNLLIYRTCVTYLHYNESECALLGTKNESEEIKDLETKVQPYTTEILMIKSIVEGICPALFIFFLGPWSDKNGRKPLILSSLTGLTLVAILQVVFCKITTLGPAWVILTIIPLSLCGGTTALFTATFSYVTDISSEENRSFRISVLEVAIYGGALLGSVISSYLLSVLGYLNVLLLTCGIYCCILLYGIFFIKESINVLTKRTITTLFDFTLVRDMFKVCWKIRPDYDRAILFTLIIANSLNIFVLYGLINISYLFTRMQLGWNLTDFSIFNAYSIVILVVGIFVGVTLLQKLCKMSDSLLSMISYLSSMAEDSIRIFATQTWHMYLGSSISILRGLSSPLSRSIMSKIVLPEEAAKFYSLSSALESVFPVVAPIICNMLYVATLTTFPGAVFILTSGLYFTCFILQCFVQYWLVKYPREHRLLVNEE